MKKIVNEQGHILMLSPLNGVEITDEEAAAILAELENIPKDALSGFAYRLRDDTHEWELYEIPTQEESEELTAEEALDIIVGGGIE